MSRARFSIPSVLQLAHQFVGVACNRLPDNAPRFAIDTTVGNGYDTAFLAECVGPGGRVIGCDIQELALQKARGRLEQAHLLERVILLNESHSRLGAHVPHDWRGQVCAMMANLGYLPGSDKATITTAATTTEMLRNVLPYLRVGGVMTLVIYSGHPGGQEECDAVTNYLHELSPTDWRVFHADFPSQNNHPPALIAVERT